jgi:hypothetical protein
MVQALLAAKAHVNAKREDGETAIIPFSHSLR